MAQGTTPDIRSASYTAPVKWSERSHPRVLIGGAGAPNYGDELILKGWMDHLGETLPPETNLVFFENIARYCTALHLPEGHPLADRVKFKDRLARLSKQYELPTIWHYIEHGYDFMRNFGFVECNHKSFAEMFDSETIHFHGGGYLSNAGAKKAIHIGMAASFAKYYGTRVVATGIGFGPITDHCPDRAKFQEILGQFESFEVRDAISLEQLREIAPDANVHHGTDDCFILPLEKVVRRDSSVRRLHLSFSHGQMDGYPASFWPWLAAEAKGFDEVVYWESYPYFDQQVVESLRPMIPDIKVHPIDSLLFDPPAVGSEDVFITHRFHVHYAAARIGARGFYLARTPYYVQKHESIAHLGSGLQPLAMENPPSLQNLPAASPLDEVTLRAKKLAVAANCYRPVISAP